MFAGIPLDITVQYLVGRDHDRPERGGQAAYPVFQRRLQREHRSPSLLERSLTLLVYLAEPVGEPPGEWALKKVRSLLGRGLDDTPGTVRFETRQVSIPGPWPHFVVPRSLGSFTRGRTYAHEGLSLAEVVLPALRVQLPAPNRPAQRTRLFLRYSKATVTTRQPMITAEAVAGDQLYDESPPVEFRITVLGSEGQVVGQLGSHSTVVDISSQLVRLPAGELARLPIRLNEAYEGPFIIRASDPDTQVELFSLPLQTKYEL